MKYISNMILVIFIFFVIIFIFSYSIKCDHSETVKVFSFQNKNSTAMSDMKVYCKHCRANLKIYGFYGIPNDSAYLDVMNNGFNFEDGEYYTLTATVTIGAYASLENSIRCSISKNDIVVNFNVTFIEEYREKVDLLKNGDEITFLGKCSTDGMYCVDCILLDN